MISLKWEQVNAWRLSQHCLSQRLNSGDFVQAVGQTLGVHAQVMSAAELAIAARVDGLTSEDIQSALWSERSLVKAWMMRQTLHLVPAAAFPTYIAARRLTDINWAEIFGKKGIDQATLDAYLAAAPDILSGKPLTRQEFVEAVGQRVRSAELNDFLVNGAWGTVFKPLAWRGELCFGPNQGQNSTFVRPRAWISGWQEIDPESAMREIVRCYLQTYGPSRPRIFQVWWWMSSQAAKQAFDSIAGETEQVDVEGWRATALSAALPAIQELEPSSAVHLLPAFDVYTIGSMRAKDLDRLISIEHQKKIFSQQGWVSAVLLVGGYVNGTWEHKQQRTATAVKVNLFAPVSATVKDKIATEAERLGKFLNSSVVLEFNEQ